MAAAAYQRSEARRTKVASGTWCNSAVRIGLKTKAMVCSRGSCCDTCLRRMQTHGQPLADTRRAAREAAGR